MVTPARTGTSIQTRPRPLPAEAFTDEATYLQTRLPVDLAATLIPDGGAHFFRNLGEIANQFFHALCGQHGIGANGLIQIRDIGLVMPVVVDFHRLGIDVRFQRIKCVRQRGELEWSGWSCSGLCL